MDSHWVNQRPGYRCRHGHTSAKSRTPDQPSNPYVREDRLLDGLASCLGLAEYDEIGPYLRARHLLVVCGTGGFEIRPAEGSKPGP